MQSGETPLHVAARNCHYAVARSLLDHWRRIHPEDTGATLVNAQNEVSITNNTLYSRGFENQPTQGKEF